MSLSADKILEECVGAIGPYLDQLVVAGGWVPYLYVKLYEGPATHEPLLTVDFDAAIARHEFVERALDELSHCSYHTETKNSRDLSCYHVCRHHFSWHRTRGGTAPPNRLHDHDR